MDGRNRRVTSRSNGEESRGKRGRHGEEVGRVGWASSRAGGKRLMGQRKRGLRKTRVACGQDGGDGRGKKPKSPPYTKKLIAKSSGKSVADQEQVHQERKGTEQTKCGGSAGEEKELVVL